MNRKMIASAVMLATWNAKSQSYTEYDTLRKSEISVSVSPMLNYMFGSESSYLSNFNFSYKRYFKNRYVLRTAFVIFPQPNPRSYYSENYDRTIDSVNVFSTYRMYGSPKTQVNIGLERIFKVNRLTHGAGAEVFFNHQRSVNELVYRWQPINAKPAVGVFNQHDTTNYGVDSLGFKKEGRMLGGGIQIFYTLRYKISKRWYVSATMGPSANFSVFNGTYVDRKAKTEGPLSAFQMDFPNVPFISDVSICFRL